MALQDIDYDSRIGEAIKFLRLVGEADSQNRAEALGDLKFAAGDQWPVEIQNSRNLESRPCLTINKIDAYVRQVTNQQRQQRPRIKVHPVNNEGDLKIAQVIEGITRHIEVNSNADTAYDTAFEYAVKMGWGYWRVNTNYVSEDSFDQEIYIDAVDDPFSVYFDPNSVNPDGSDAERCLITSVMSKREFRQQYPGADDGANFSARATGDSDAEWVTKEDIRLAEYWYVEREKATLVLLSDGTKVYEDELPSPELLDADNITIMETRSSYRRKVKWCKLTAMEVLEEREWPGKFIPIIPCYGAQVVVEGKRKKYGLVRFAKDPQRMYNFWRTSMTESIALAPKPKWLIAEGQDEGHESEWALANIKSTPILRYKQKDIEGVPAPVPSRIQPEPPPDGIMVAASAIADDLKTVLGIFDPAQALPGNLSGKALQGQQQQVDLSNFHFYDNMTRSIKQTGKIILDLIPKIYDTTRVLRIIGVDGKPDLVTINEMQATGEVMNNVTVGLYDVVMETGPGYNSKRQQAVDMMMPLMTEPQVFQAAGDLLFRNMDFPGADVIADRLAAMNPLSQIDDQSNVPPQVQMQLLQAQKTIADMEQKMIAMQLEINNRGQVAQIKEEGQNKRKLMDVVSRAYNTDTINEARVNQSAIRAVTDQNRMELDAMVRLVLKGLPAEALQAEMARRDAEQQQVVQFAEQEVNQTQNPFISMGQALMAPQAPPMQ
jgi:Phage P22-like portal protein